VCLGLGGRRKHTLQDNPILQARVLTLEGSSSTLGIGNTFGKVLPCGAGAGSHASSKPAQSRRSQTAVRGAYNRPAVTSDPPLLPRPAGERAGSHAGGMQPRQMGAFLRLPTCPAWRPRPTRHATGAPNASCMQLHRHLRHYRASSTAEPIPRLEATQRATQQRQPGATVKCGQKWAGGNGGGRRAGAAAPSSAKLTSHPGAAREPSLTA
jgi:hypothetical protein